MSLRKGIGFCQQSESSDFNRSIFLIFLTHKALTQVLGLNSKRYVLHRTQSKHASACEQSLNKSYHSFAAI